MSKLEVAMIRRVLAILGISTLAFIGSSACMDKTTTDWSPDSANSKNFGLYSKKEAFLVSDENWKDVLKLVSVTTWSTGVSKTI